MRDALARLLNPLLRHLPWQTVRPGPVVGCIDGISGGRLHGWAFDRFQPQRRLTIDIEGSDGTRLAVLADRYRADLQQYGIGDGHYGFSIPLRRLANAKRVRLATRVPYIELGRAELRTERSLTAVQHVLHAGSYDLQIDRPGIRTHVTGWAAGRAMPLRRRTIRLRGEGTILGEQRATLFRAELAKGDCDGFHGFSFARPSLATRSLALEDVESGSLFNIPA